jgi:hypothetical protein
MGIDFICLPKVNKPAYLNKVYIYKLIAFFLVVCEELLTKTGLWKGFQADINSPSTGLQSDPVEGRAKNLSNEEFKRTLKTPDSPGFESQFDFLAAAGAWACHSLFAMVLD